MANEALASQTGCFNFRGSISDALLYPDKKLEPTISRIAARVVRLGLRPMRITP